jgi:hypothetical protein
MRWLVVIAFAARLAHADAVDDLEARGEELAKTGEYSKAIAAFKQAEAQRPRAVHACMIGLAYLRRELWPQAELYFATCHKRAKPDDQLPDWIGTAETQLAQRIADAHIVPVMIQVVPADIGAMLSVSSFPPDEVFPAQDLHLAPGTHSIEISANGYTPQHRDITIEPGKPVTLVFTLALASGVTPQPPPSSPHASRVPWIVMGGGAAHDRDRPRRRGSRHRRHRPRAALHRVQGRAACRRRRSCRRRLDRDRVAAMTRLAIVLVAGCHLSLPDAPPGDASRDAPAPDAQLPAYGRHWVERTYMGDPADANSAITTVQASLTFDSTRNRVVMLTANTTQLVALDPGTGWSPVCTVGTRPQVRHHAAFAYDPDIDRYVVAGGSSNADFDTFDPVATVDACDPVANTWSTLAPLPMPRARLFMLYDPMRHGLRVFGGFSAPTTPVAELLLSDTAVTTWTPSSSTQAFGAHATGATFVPGDHILVIPDDDSPSDQIMNDDLWSLDGAGTQWTHVCSDCSGYMRNDASLLQIGAETFLINGYHPPMEIKGTWRLDGAKLTLVDDTNPPARDSEAVVYDPVRDVGVVYGGNGVSCSDGGPKNGNDCHQTWELVRD